MKCEWRRLRSHPTRAGSLCPAFRTGEQLIATFLVPGSGDALAFPQAKPLPVSAVENGRLKVSGELSGPYSAVFFISSRTGMMVKRPAVGAEGFVLDHYDQKAIENHLHAVGDRLLDAFGDHPPYAVFSDSLEDYGSNWTGDLLGTIPATPRLRPRSPSAGTGSRCWAGDGGRPARLGRRPSPNSPTNVFSCPARVGAAASHAASFADLWIPSGHSLQQPV